MFHKICKNRITRKLSYSKPSAYNFCELYFLQCEGDHEKMRKLDHHKNTCNQMKVNLTKELEHVDMDR